MAPDKPEKALPSAQVRLNVTTGICLLQRPEVFPTSSACFRAPGSTLGGSTKLETTAWWSALHMQLPAPALCQCTGSTSVSSWFRSPSAKQKGLDPLRARAGFRLPYQWLLPLMSKPAAPRSYGKSLKYHVKQADFTLIGINRASNIPVGQKRRSGFAVWLIYTQCSLKL